VGCGCWLIEGCFDFEGMRGGGEIDGIFKVGEVRCLKRCLRKCWGQMVLFPS
jgi:hypothetical protein